MMSQNLLNEILARHGVSDAHELMDRMEDALVKRTDEPDVHMRGSIHQMKNLVSDRKSIQTRFSELKHL